MASVLHSQNFTTVLTKIARLVDPTVTVLPTVTVEVDTKNGGSVEFHGVSGMSAIINGLSKGRLGIGHVGFYYAEPSRPKRVAHAVTLVVKHTKAGKQYYLVDANGRMTEDWGRQMPIIVEDGLRQVMNDPNLDLHVFDTNNANFKPTQETRTFLEEEFGIINVPDLALCNTFAFCYAFELICTSEVGPDADRLTRFLYRDLLRRSKIYTQEQYLAREEGTVREFTPREEAEIMLYTRALAFGMLRHLLPDQDIPLFPDVAQPIASEPTVTVRRTWVSSPEPRLENVNR